MEFFAVIAVIVVLCLVMGVGADIMITAALGLVALIIFAMALLFIFFSFRLLRSHRTDAVFRRVERPEGKKFRCAYYEIDGKEYPCVFPSEPKLMYKQDKTYKVFLHRKSGTVFDRFALTTCVLGLVLSLALSAGAVWLGIIFFKG